MISIKSQWVEKILNGEKTIEIRKTMPKCELPCKVYIYCTNGYMLYDIRNENYLKVERKCTLDYARKSNKYLSGTPPMLNRKVVAEFTLNKVEKIKFDCPCSFSSFNMGFGFTENRYNIDVTKTCLTESQLYDYLGEPFEIQGEYHQTFEFSGYAWHIDNLKIYDKPKELSEFYIETIDDDCCVGCPYHETPIEERPCKNCYGNRKYITRPPQSWCYVEQK